MKEERVVDAMLLSNNTGHSKTVYYLHSSSSHLPQQVCSCTV